MDHKALSLVSRPEADWNDPEAMDDLYRRHAAWLGDRLRRRFGPMLEADAEDLVQETYVKLAPHQASLVRRPRALLMRVASNLAKDLLRRRAVRSRHAETVGLDPEAGKTRDDAAGLLAAKDVILSLPADYRDVFILSRFHRLTYEEIAERCGISVKSVEWRLQKAIAHCAKRLKD
ncbi:MAG: hypothetical protein BGN86_15505 [Caulobacterales bacterium 68-7]|nr:MAG: hypothetical protein BGN86_15505 [Caulobacterales bacterium 68-7]